MTTKTEEVQPQHLHVDDVYAAIEAHGSGVAMGLLWLVPALVFLAGVARSLS